MVESPINIVKTLLFIIGVLAVGFFLTIIFTKWKSSSLKNKKIKGEELWWENKLLRINFILIICIYILIYNFSGSLYKLSYGIILLTSILLIIHWCAKWVEFKKQDSKTQIDISKKYDIQFKRFAKYMLFLFFLYILYGVLEFREKNKGYYLNRISIANSLKAYGYNDTALLLELHELKEQTNDFEFRTLVTKRNPYGYIDLKKQDDQSINFKVEGIEFPLKNVGLLIGEELWGDRKKYIDMAITEDVLKLKVTVNITGESVKIFEEYFEGYFEKQFCLQSLLREVGYYILEMTDPVMASNYYKAQNQPNKALDILLNYKDTNINWSNWNVFRGKFLLYWELHNYEQAELINNKLLSFAPKFGLLLNDKGTVEQAKGNILSAQIYYSKTIEIDSLDLPAYMNKVSYFYRYSFNLDSALFFCTKPLTYNYDYPYERKDVIECMLMASFLYRLKGDKKNSEYYFVKACNFSPYSFDYIKQSWALFPLDTVGNYDQKFKQLLKSDKKYLPAMLASAFNSNKPAEKESLFRECLSRYPELIPAQIGLASILFPKHITANKLFYLKQDFYEPDSLLKKLLSKQPDNYIVNHLLGAEQLACGDFILAEHYIKRSLELNKFYEEGFKSLINLLEAQGRDNEIIALSQKMFYYTPFNDICNYELGNYHYLNRNYQRAEYYLVRAESFAQTIEIKEDSQFELAYNYYSWKHYSSAIPYFNKLLSQKNGKGENVDVLMKLRQCYIQIGDQEKVTKIENKIKSLNVSFDNKRTLVN